MYAHIYASILLGYYVSPTKSTLFPTQSMVHLGFGIDSRTMSFSITDKYKKKFRAFRSEMLLRGTANLLDLQKWVGKCNHLRMVFPANSLFTFEARALMARVGETRVPLPKEVVEEMNFWSFVDSHTEPVPFLQQQHVTVRLFTDASGFGWGAVVNGPEGPTTVRDYWTTDLFGRDICTKEALAVLFGLQSIEDRLFGRRVEVQTDNEGLALAWSGLRSRSGELAEVLKMLFLYCVDLKMALKLTWVSTHDNPADAPSRELDRADSSLRRTDQERLWSEFGPFDMDLMALPSNAFCDPQGRKIPFISRYPTPSSAHVDVFAQCCPEGRLYVFPPFAVVVPVIRLLIEWGAPDVILVLPTRRGARSPWEGVLGPYIVRELELFPPFSVGVLRLPTAQGYGENMLPLSFGLKACRCRFPAQAPAPAPGPLVPVKTLVVADSMLRAFRSMIWPAPHRVMVKAVSGLTVEHCGRVLSGLAEVQCDNVVIHLGVNDASRGDESFEGRFRQSCGVMRGLLVRLFSGRSVLVSLVCQTKLDAVNVRVGLANKVLRELARTEGWRVVSNDNIHFGDLSDDVHLNAAGTARIHRNFLNAMR